MPARVGHPVLEQLRLSAVNVCLHFVLLHRRCRAGGAVGGHVACRQRRQLRVKPLCRARSRCGARLGVPVLPLSRVLPPQLLLVLALHLAEKQAGRQGLGFGVGGRGGEASNRRRRGAAVRGAL